MLTKKQMLWAAPILILTFAALWLSGAVAQEMIPGKNVAITALLATAFIANVFALIFIFFSIFLSFGSALLFNASGPEYWEKTGNPFYYLLWKELQEATTAGRPDSTDRRE
ncbi:MULTISPECIES: hypothetical protein [Sinorhizobium]|uniref:hypothetical protein n=1 Tax=Sinorhizobium TaxID=28105 RepID=UPI000BE940C8|nr:MULTISPECIES: hypothetical protein [Sinorhizobium]PDT50056.1 hypothetical protein CO664_26435 [Sinorhizobium sp. NG07B]POH33703.1 hypothetical protein ATY30_01585 [Sinorhizobium americanum]